MNDGLGHAMRLYDNRTERARELKGEGKKVVGYLCANVPVELITAAGLVPYRITGTLQPITEADAHLETLMCPFVRSVFELKLKGKYEFLDGIVWPHTCDNIQKMYDIWRYHFPSSFFYYFDVPHMTDLSSFVFFAKEIERLRKSLGQFSGDEVTDERLSEAITLHNENRNLWRQLSDLRKPDPPLVSGTELTQIMVASSHIPVDESNEMLRSITQEIKTRGNSLERKEYRLLVYGCQIDDAYFMNLVEETGANVVIDDLCMGTRLYWTDVPANGDPIAGLAKHYLGDIMCARTYRRPLATRQESLESRYGHLRDFVESFGVNGAILYVIAYCDTYEFDVMDARDYLEGMGIPCLYIEDDYSLSSNQALKTRIQAFLEMVH
jgi:bzd-type benzoyl-CoA reductase N subunit